MASTMHYTCSLIYTYWYDVPGQTIIVAVAVFRPDESLHMDG